MWRLGALALAGILGSFLSPALALAQDGLSNEQLKRMYDDAVVQLRAAQDRRNELARESERLKIRIAQLEKELEQARQAANTVADKTFQARAERSAFNAFLQDNPAIRAQWELFLQRNLLTPSGSPDVLDQDWPLSAKH